MPPIQKNSLHSWGLPRFLLEDSGLIAYTRQAAQSTVYAFSARPLTGGEPVSLGSLRGKVLLIENVASL